MKNFYSLISLAASLLVAVNTDWCKPSKILVIFSALVLLISALKGLNDCESERNKN